jgi:hypothetical protein
MDKFQVISCTDRFCVYIGLKFELHDRLPFFEPVIGPSLCIAGTWGMLFSFSS